MLSRPRRAFLLPSFAVLLVMAASSAQAELAVIEPIADATLIQDANGALADGAGAGLFAGRTSQDAGALRRALIAFDVAGSLPSGAQVTAATLQLSLLPSNPDAASMNLHRVVTAWSEGPAAYDGGRGAPAGTGDVTWLHTRFPDQLWSAPGGDFASAASASADAAGAGPTQWLSTPQLVADVQLWLEQPSRSHGWILLGDEGRASTAKSFASREHPDDGLRPRLEIEFVRRGDVCGEAGYRGAELGLCDAYCEALDCDTATTRAPDRVCEQLASSFLERSGAEELPCEVPDADADAVPDEGDNCPDDPNTDQSDRDLDGLGDACDNCPTEPNPGQEDSFGRVGVGDVCDCPCFTSLEVSALLLSTEDPAIYGAPSCVDTRVLQKPLTAVAVLRLDGSACSNDGLDCSALSVEFTEDRVCQLNPPAPIPGVTVQGISEAQGAACRGEILSSATVFGLSCN